MQPKFTMSRWLKSLSCIALSATLCIGTNEASAQISAASYGYSAVAGTYTDLTGGTAVTSIQQDDALSANINIGFTFNYCGTAYTQFKVNSNGWLTFGAGTTDGGTMRNNNTTNLAMLKPVLMPLWDDLEGTNGVATYKLEGTTPNRVLTMEWENWKWYNFPIVNPEISFQVKLYETTNIIEFVYKQEPNFSTFPSATIGIADGAATAGYLSLNNSTATATASSTVFTTGIATRPATGQIYRFTPPPACNTITTWPAVTAATIFPANLCVSGNVNLNLTTAMPSSVGLTYQWQSSTTATGPWTDIGTAGTAPAFTATGVNTPLFFRCRVICNGTTTVWTSNASPQVTVSNPGTPTITNGSRCGPGTVVLAAAPTASGPTIRWFTAPTGGYPVGTGTSYTTPFLTSTTTFYASAGTPNAIGTPTIGAGALTTSFSAQTPFFGGWGGSKHQFLIRASELIAAGIAPGSSLSSIAMDLVSGGAVYQGFRVSLKNTTTNALPTAFEGGVIDVTVPTNYTTTVGINTFNFPQPFIWTGDNLLVQTCWSNNNSSNPYSDVKYDNTTFAATFYGVGDGESVATICNNPPNPSITFNSRPQFILGYDASCQGPRVPVVATINAGPALTVSAPPAVCNGSIGTIQVTSPLGNFASYTWSPTADLYTNATATTPYNGGNASTLYFKSTVVGQHAFALYATNTSGQQCSGLDTAKIWVQPKDVTISGDPDTICITGSTILRLVPNSGYAPGSIQWQESSNGTTYTDINGATGVSYTTPTLSANRYYKALIKAGTTNCETPVKLVVIADPVVNSALDSFHCGPGEVVLTAQTGGNSIPLWYTSATGGLPVGSGNTFTTPFLAATTSFYVTGGGGSAGYIKMVGSGASVSNDGVTPFYSGWGGCRHQYLITAAELLAAGIPAGAELNSLAFDVVAGATTYQGFTISMKTTTATALTTTWETNTMQVRVPTDHAAVPGVNTMAFDVPFSWDGTSNIVIQTCWSNQNNNNPVSTVRYDNTTYAATHYAQSDGQTPTAMCGTTNTGSTLNRRPKLTIGYKKRCESPREEVIAYIHPVPVVELGTDMNKCVEEGAVEVLDAGFQANGPTFLWDDGTSTQVRGITQTGTYYVKVTNQYTCSKSDTINVILRTKPEVELGNDTTVCNGVILTLDAGNDGIEYFWNTGANTQSISINTPGSYNVFVTNSQGCIKEDTIVVTMQGELPTIQGINISNNGLYTFNFAAVNPQNVIGYDWDFGDNSPHSYQSEPTHTYADGGNYIVTLTLSSSCGFYTDSTSAHIVGINQLSVGQNEVSVYPNPTQEVATILSKGALKMEKVEVYNILGQVIYTSKADDAKKHTLKLDGIASGLYTIQIYTDKGAVARKLEIIK
jgi:hypothetical protein